MTDDIYHDTIMRLARGQTGHGRLDRADGRGSADNPLCGDRAHVEITLREGAVGALAHRVQGCVLCQAAAAIIGTTAPGQPAGALRDAAEALRQMLETGAAPPGGAWAELAVFAPVTPHRSRHDCVLLPFQALMQALDGAARDDGDGSESTD